MPISNQVGIISVRTSLSELLSVTINSSYTVTVAGSWSKPKIAIRLLVVLVVGATLFKRLRRFKSDRDEIWQDLFFK